MSISNNKDSINKRHNNQQIISREINYCLGKLIHLPSQLNAKTSLYDNRKFWPRQILEVCNIIQIQANLMKESSRLHAKATR